MRTVAQIALGAVVGAVAASAITLHTAAAPPPSPGHDDTNPATHQPVAFEQQAPGGPRQLATLEARLGQLEARLAGLDGSVRNAEGPASPQDIQAGYVQVDAQLETHYQQEGRDSAWAARATRAVDEGVRHVSERGTFRVRDVGCKTTLCKATLEWPTRAAAQKEYRKLLREQFGVNCTRSIYLPEADNPNTPFTAVEYFDCTDARASGQ